LLEFEFFPATLLYLWAFLDNIPVLIAERVASVEVKDFVSKQGSSHSLVLFVLFQTCVYWHDPLAFTFSA